MATRRRSRAATCFVSVSAIAASLLMVAAAGPAAVAQTVGDVEARDRLIASQENLLNTYRCLFGVDTDVVPGGCPEPDEVSPGVAPGNPTQQDIDVRDGLIQSQEALLNVYRCRFDVDTEIVPGGCVGGKPATAVELPPEGWLADPTCRNVYRWWDGQQWTDEVANDGVRSIDPLQNDDDVSPPAADGSRDCIGQDWLLDPTCRNVYRWWDGQQWTERVANGGVRGTDPLRSGENPPPPVMGVTPDCSVAPAYPLTAEELGCEAVSPPVCEIGDDGYPVALRLMTYDEIAANSQYGTGGGSQVLSPVRPVSVSDTVALGYVTECLVEWPTYEFSRFEFNQVVAYQNRFFVARPVATCNALWRLPVMAIDHMGADVRCVWDRFEAYFLHLEPRYSDYQYSLTGWAEVCDSWLDPVPELRYQDKCINLLRMVSPAMYDALGLGNATVSCTFADTDFDIYDAIELRGRCAALRGLGNMSRRFREFARTNNVEWDEARVLPEIPGNARFIC